MSTLKDCIEAISADATWGIWAELIGGKFNSQSKARYAQVNNGFENGGLPNGFKFFANGLQICDDHSVWKGDFDISDWGTEWDALVGLWERETQTEWVGDRKTITTWIDGAGSDSAAALISEAEAKWDTQCSELSNQWIEELIEEQNQLLMEFD